MNINNIVFKAVKQTPHLCIEFIYLYMSSKLEFALPMGEGL